MNSQELRALQEAYSQVYAPQELDEGYMPPTQKRADKMMKQSSKLHRTGSERGDFGNPESEKKHTQASKIAFMSRRMSDKAKERDKESKKSEFNVKEDLYDIILSHLIDEGYADTEQAAEAIMVNMSEDWRESIIEDNSTGKTMTVGGQTFRDYNSDGLSDRQKRMKEFGEKRLRDSLKGV